MSRALCGTHQFQTTVTTGTTPVGTPLNVEGYSIVGFQIVGMNTGTVAFQASLTSEPTTTTWVSIRATDLATGTPATTASADGISQLDVRGVVAVRALVTTLSRVADGQMNVYGFRQTETS